MARAEAWCRRDGDKLILSGELTVADIDGFHAEIDALGPLPECLSLELAGFEIGDGMAAVAAVDAVRRLAQGRSLVLRNSPQLLAHNLYRIGALEEGNLLVVDMREDEPYG
jgi:hypothetical protein